MARLAPAGGCQISSTFRQEAGHPPTYTGNYVDLTDRPGNPAGFVRCDHECRLRSSHEAESKMGLGTFVVCVFRPGRGRGPDPDRFAYGPWALVDIYRGLQRNISENGFVRCLLGSVFGVFWSSPN